MMIILVMLCFQAQFFQPPQYLHMKLLMMYFNRITRCQCVCVCVLVHVVVCCVNSSLRLRLLPHMYHLITSSPPFD
eukprot:m.65464 g.65464  ORF g.65464 m.65464 type:complete len:76 (-) comp8153_c0_seq3:1457-1684(-)